MSVVTATIESSGRTLDPQVQVVAIDVEKEVDRIPRARIVVVDGSPLGEFSVSDSDFFAPGAPIELKLRYEGEPDVTVFKGLAVRQRIEVSGGESLLAVELRDAAIALTHPRQSAVYRDMTDEKIIGQLIDEAKLSAGKLAPTSAKHAELVRYGATSWDFLLSRADVAGLSVVVDDGSVSTLELGKTSGVQHAIQYGIDEIYGFEAELDSTRQVASLESSGWDLDARGPTKPFKAAELTLAQGNAEPASLAEALGFTPLRLSHQAAFEDQELQAWADARLARSRLSLLRGRLALPGRADVKPLDELELKSFGARFDGKALITGVRHRLTNDGWFTDLQLGLSAEWFCERPQVEEPPAGGLLPPVSGLQIGVVQEFKEDPLNRLRVRVHLPSLNADPKEGAVWARLATPDAGPGRGIVFRPEPDDEVVVGFIGDDPRQAIILGGLFGPKNGVPEGVTLDKDNKVRGLVTRSGASILFSNDDKDSKKPSLTLKTPGGCVVVLDDDAKSVELRDSHGNSILMDSKGVKIKSAADFKVDAGSGNVEIAGKKVDIK